MRVSYFMNSETGKVSAHFDDATSTAELAEALSEWQRHLELLEPDDYPSLAAVSSDYAPIRSEPQITPPPLDSTPVEALPLRHDDMVEIRIANVLRHNGITAVEQIENTPDVELLKMRNFGRGLLDRLRQRVSDYRLYTAAKARVQA